MGRIALSMAALAALAAALPARAADTETTHDLRCLAATSVIATAPDERVRMAGLSATLYFLGRLDGREPGLDLAPALATALEGLDPEQVEDLATECGGQIVERGQSLEAVGRELSRMEPDPLPLTQ